MLIFIPGMVLYFAYFPFVKYMLNQVESNCHLHILVLHVERTFNFAAESFQTTVTFFL